jgi:hypothetical protein
MAAKRIVTKAMEAADAKLGSSAGAPWIGVSGDVFTFAGETETMFLKLVSEDESRKADYPIHIRMTRKDALMLAGVLYEYVGILTKSEAKKEPVG